MVVRPILTRDPRPKFDSRATHAADRRRIVLVPRAPWRPMLPCTSLVFHFHTMPHAAELPCRPDDSDGISLRSATVVVVFALLPNLSRITRVYLSLA